MTTDESKGQAIAARAPEEVLYEGRPAVIPDAGALVITILTVGIAALFYWIRSLGKHYRITTQRIVIEAGVFSKRLEQIDLYRVTDYVVERPFSQRLMGTGNILIQSVDKTTEKISLIGLRTDVRDLYERMRSATEAAKTQRGVRILENET